MRPLEVRYAKAPRKRMPDTTEGPRRKKPRVVFREPVFWDWFADRVRRLEILGDSKLVVNWVRGIWACKFRPYKARMQEVIGTLENHVTASGLRPRCRDADFARHIFRELNGEADALAGKHCDEYNFWKPERLTEFHYYRVFFDGSAAPDSSGAGWVLYGTESILDDPAEWEKIAAKSLALPKGCSVTAAELEACASAVEFLDALLSGEMDIVEACLKQKARMDFKAVRKLELADLL